MPIVAMGTVLRMGGEAIANLTSIDGVGVSADTIETTALDTEGGYRTFVTSLKDAGEVSLSGHFDHASHVRLFSAFENSTIDSYAIEFPDLGLGTTPSGTTWTFSGVVTGFSTSAELEDLISFECTIKVSGKPTLIAPSIA